MMPATGAISSPRPPRRVRHGQGDRSSRTPSVRRNCEASSTEAAIPPTMTHGKPSRVRIWTAATAMTGPSVRPNSPPTIQRPMPRPMAEPASLATKAGPTA
jgi:hypothetical protein